MLQQFDPDAVDLVRRSLGAVITHDARVMLLLLAATGECDTVWQDFSHDSSF